MTRGDISELEKRKERERLEIILAQQTKKTRSYIDTDGCEVTVTPGGHVFYNAADWW